MTKILEHPTPKLVEEEKPTWNKSQASEQLINQEGKSY